MVKSEQGAVMVLKSGKDKEQGIHSTLSLLHTLDNESWNRCPYSSSYDLPLNIPESFAI